MLHVMSSFSYNGTYENKIENFSETLPPYKILFKHAMPEKTATKKFITAGYVLWLWY